MEDDYRVGQSPDEHDINVEIDETWLENIVFPEGLEPTLWRMIVMPLTAPEKSAGGIMLPASSQDAQVWAQYIGVIVAMGELCWKAPQYKQFDDYDKIEWPKVGDLVMFAKQAPFRFEKDGRKFVMVNDNEVLAKIDDPKGYKAYIV